MTLQFEFPSKALPALKARLGYAKTKMVAREATSGELIGLNWDGGSRDQYAAFTFPGWSELKTLPPWKVYANGERYDLPRGVVVVRYGTFCGKQATINIDVHPEDMREFELSLR